MKVLSLVNSVRVGLKFQYVLLYYVFLNHEHSKNIAVIVIMSQELQIDHLDKAPGFTFRK